MNSSYCSVTTRRPFRNRGDEEEEDDEDEDEEEAFSKNKLT
jgi:hypothetical protein